jgi:hypothetical protein
VWVPRTVARLLTSAFVVVQALRPAFADQHDRSPVSLGLASSSGASRRAGLWRMRAGRPIAGQRGSPATGRPAWAEGRRTAPAKPPRRRSGSPGRRSSARCRERTQIRNGRFRLAGTRPLRAWTGVAGVGGRPPSWARVRRGATGPVDGVSRPPCLLAHRFVVLAVGGSAAGGALPRAPSSPGRRHAARYG